MLSLYREWTETECESIAVLLDWRNISFRCGLSLAESNCLRVITLTMWKKSGENSLLRCWSERNHFGQLWRGQSRASGWPEVTCFELARNCGFPYFRLELLLQIANKIQNGALNCEEKLTLAKNTLQAVSLCSVLPLSRVHHLLPSALMVTMRRCRIRLYRFLVLEITVCPLPPSVLQVEPVEFSHS